MSDTSTLVVNQFTEDCLFALHILGRGTDHKIQRWFALVLPALRKKPEGVTIKQLRKAVGLPGLPESPEQYDFNIFINDLFKAGVIWYGRPGSGHAVYSFIGPIRLSPNFWLKDTARRQSQPYCACTVT